MTDFLDDVLALESVYAREGAAAGEHDGALRAKADGMVLGLQKGAEVAAELGHSSGCAAALQWLQARGHAVPARAQQTHIKLVAEAAHFAPHVGDSAYTELMPAVQTARARLKTLRAQLGLSHNSLPCFPVVAAASTPSAGTESEQRSSSAIAPSTLRALKAGSLTF